MEFLLYCLLTIGGSVAASSVVTYLMRKRIRDKAIADTMEAFNDVLTDCADHFMNKCSKCGHSRNGCPCENPDYRNIVMFSECTNFEERRY